ncbi:hypothetical protein DL89DRAFT_136074 [Linderina pennispora]|uniref:GLTSCR protein conserved domain-containing protein n=1 Tax=Linderina pennispora TaxID=61395 RepID=A0A1Y1WAJ1_9FUNG|nr:uncharacterized protein DL89DRAFT_136074 [Linderina pennispora]ORX70559.1 hypothetical protein DL89DRAFT_136074 [Linderina pennispora]
MPLAKKTPSLNTVAAAAVSQQSAMEKMYQSAYLKLLNNPAVVLKKLSPPVDLAAILKTRGSAPEGLGRSEMLLTVLKALTKSQASQLASMYDQEVKARSGGLPAINTSGLRTPTGARSGEVSPSVASMSGGESDTHYRNASGTGMETPKKRKYNKTGKYSVKKRMANAEQQAMVSAPSTPTGGRERLSLQQSQPIRADHPDLRRFASLSIEQRQQQPEEIAHRKEVGRRFREALAMDHQMVQNPDWHTPFRNTKDAIERLLPFHIYQYSDRALDAGIEAAERSVEVSAASTVDTAREAEQPVQPHP